MTQRLFSISLSLVFLAIVNQTNLPNTISQSLSFHPNIAFADDASNAVQLNAKNLKKKPAAGKAQVRNLSSEGLALPVIAKFNPLYLAPPNPSFKIGIDLIARDPAVMTNLDLSPQGAATRGSQIRQMESDFRLQQKGSPQAVQMGAVLIKLYEEQSMYLENLRAMNLVDKNYADVNHFIKVTRSSLVNQINIMLRQFPKSELVPQWQSLALLSRIRIGDPSATNEALNYVRKASGDEAVRVILTGIAWDFAVGKGKSPYGTLEDAAKFTTDDTTRAVFTLFQAEQNAMQKPSAQSISLFTGAAKVGANVKRSDGKAGPVTARAVSRMVELSIKLNPDNVDNELVSTLQALGQADAARYYIEQIALKNISMQPRRAEAQYADTLGVSDSSADLQMKIQLRILDIMLASKDTAGLEGQWDRLSKMDNAFTQPGVEQKMISTQNIAWAAVTAKATPESVDRFVKMHDFFMNASKTYAINEQWGLNVVDALMRINRFADAAARADALAASSRKPDIQIAALRYSARSREKILGVAIEPTFERGRKLAGPGEAAGAYVGTLDKIVPLTKGEESERSQYQAGYISYLAGDEGNSRTRIESGISKFPKSKYAPGGVSFLIELAQVKKDYPALEKAARLAELNHIKPAKPEHSNLRSLVEIAVYESANLWASQQIYDKAADKFVAFQKEFPQSKNAPKSLDLAAKNYLAIKKVNDAINQWESSLKNYANSPFAFEHRWSAAEQSKATGQFLRAANHYEAFAKSYKKEGQQKQAWFKAAEMHKSLGRYASAINDYETHMKESTSQSEKIKVARDIADMLVKYGKGNEAIAALDRVITMSKNGEDEIWARSQMIELQMRIGQESNARRNISKVMDLKPQSQESFKLVAKAKFALAKMDTKEVREIDPGKDAKMQKSIRTLLSAYDRTKALYLAACEVPGLEWCSVGYYETGKLAEHITKKLLEIELPPTLDPKEVQPIRTLISQNSERLANESKSFADQAEQALSSGAPDADMAERIRAYAQQQKGAPDKDAPLK